MEPDGRVWLVSPTNLFGGYPNTFPKGKVSDGLSLKATAMKEVNEEAGLHIVLTGFLCDLPRSTSVTRYYWAKRVGGSPALMDWESQAVHLVPVKELAQWLSNPSDQPLIEKLMTAGSVGN